MPNQKNESNDRNFKKKNKTKKNKDGKIKLKFDNIEIRNHNETNIYDKHCNFLE